MMVKLISVGLLVTSSGPLFGQGTTRSEAAEARAKNVAISTVQYSRRYMHRCTVTPGAQWHAIGTKGTGAAGRAAQNPGQSRIDLEFTIAPPSGDEVSQMPGGHATSGQGAGDTIRLSSKPQATVTAPLSSARNGMATVNCTGGAVDSDDAALNAAMRDDRSLLSRTVRDSRGQVWSTCRTTGSGKSTQFVLTLLVQPVAAPTDRTRAPGTGAGRGQVWSTHRVSIVPRGSDVGDASLTACSSATPQSSSYDLAILNGP